MKLTFKTILSCMLFGWAANSQAQTWYATEEGFPSPSGLSSCMPLDGTTSQNFCFVAGYFTGSVTFNTTVLSSSGGTDAFLTKLSTSTGAAIWTIKASGLSGDAFKKVESIGSAVLVYGTAASGSVTFYSTSGSPVTISVPGGGFLAKYSTTGVLLWATPFTGTVVDMAFVIQTNHLYTIGVDAANANKTRIKSINEATGAVLNDVLSTNTGISTANKGIAGDAAGNCYIAVEGRTNFKLPSSPDTIVIPSGGQDIVLLKLDATLSQISYKLIGNPLNSNESLKDIDCSPSGDLYITGSYENGMINLDPATTTHTLSNVGGRDLFLAKYNSNLAIQWERKIAGTGGDYPIAMSLDLNSHPFLLVQNKQSNSVLVDPCSLIPYTSAPLTFDNKWYMVKYSPTGVIDWAAAPIVENPNALPVAILGNNNISARIVGYSNLETDFGSTALYGSGSIYYAVVKKPICKPIGITGLDENKTENELNVYPNPTTGVVNISLNADDKNVQVTITDNLGKQVMKTDNLESNHGELNMETLPAGIYFYNVIKNNTSYKGKIVKH